MYINIKQSRPFRARRYIISPTTNGLKANVTFSSSDNIRPNNFVFGIKCTAVNSKIQSSKHLFYVSNTTNSTVLGSGLNKTTFLPQRLSQSSYPTSDVSYLELNKKLSIPFGNSCSARVIQSSNRCIKPNASDGRRANETFSPFGSSGQRPSTNVNKRDSSYTDKDKVVSITYEEIGLFPRSFSRVLDRFLKQLFSDVDNLVIQEYRFYRYLFLTTIKTIFVLLFVPFVVNFVAKNYVVKPITEYFWNTSHPEIFLNSYEQKRAFSELEKFEEKIYFEALVESYSGHVKTLTNQTFLSPPNGSLNPVKGSNSYTATEQRDLYLPQSHAAGLKPEQSSGYHSVATLARNSNEVQGEWQPSLSHSSSSQTGRSSGEGLTDITKSHPDWEQNLSIAQAPIRGKNNVFVGEQNLATNLNLVTLKNDSLSPSLEFLPEVKTERRSKSSQAGNSSTPGLNVTLARNNTVEGPSAFEQLEYNSLEVTLGLPKQEQSTGSFVGQSEGPSSSSLTGSGPFLREQNIRSYFIRKNKDISKLYQEKAIELAMYYNNHSIEAWTNFFADLLSLCTLLYLLITLEIQINITKSFLLEVFFGLDDSKKSLLILLVTDLLVGYHSSNLWELFFEFIFNHYGIPESQTGIFLLVATLPVLLDVLFKYLIFRHLNRSSPATVATYQAIIE
jgi:hypothetical protein